MSYGLGEDEIVDYGRADLNYAVCLVPIKRLLPTEEHSAAAAGALAESIDQAGFWTTPIFVEKNLLFVMDGHHRLAAARLLALDFLPCILLAYDDPRVELTAWRDQRPVAVDDVISAATSGILLPRKTTRHRLTPEVDSIRIELSQLKR